MVLRDVRFGVEPDDGENLRRIGRSLSGTVVASRRSRLTATRSLVSVTSCALLPPCGCAFELHLPDVPPWHFTHCSSLCSALLPLLFVSFLPVVLLFDFGSVLPPLLLFPLSLSKVKQADVSASPCLLPLF